MSRIITAFAQLRWVGSQLSRRVGEQRLTQVAGSLTFTTVLSLVPLFAVALALFTAFPLFRQFRDAFEDYLLASLLPPAMSANILNYINQFAAKASRLTAVGGVFLFLGALSVMLTIDAALNQIWRVRRPRPLIQRVLIYWAALTLGPLLLGLSLWASSWLASSSAGLIAQVPLALDVALLIGPILLTAFALSGLFMLVPNRPVRWVDAFVGALLAAVIFELMKIGFAYYVTRFPTYNRIYGAFAVLPLFLLWVYLSWLVLLLGATVAALMPNLRTRPASRRGHSPAEELRLALDLLAELSQQNSEAPAGRTLMALVAGLHAEPERLEAWLERWRTWGWVQRSDEQSGHRWVLLQPLAELPFAPVMEAVLWAGREPAGELPAGLIQLRQAAVGLNLDQAVAQGVQHGIGRLGHE